MRDILLLGIARENSTRCPNKMIRDFHNTTIFDIYLNKLTEIREIYTPEIFSNAIIAISPEDKTLYNISKMYPLRLQERNHESVKQGAVLNEIFNFPSGP